MQTWTDNFQEEMIGKYLWQYEIVTTFCNGEVLNSGMPSIALTESREEPPCCFPGYCNDMSSFGCYHCRAGFRVDMRDQCAAGAQAPCEGTVLQLQGVNAYITLQEMAGDEQRTINCPDPYRGTVSASSAVAHNG